jgi:hypothetical protein
VCRRLPHKNTPFNYVWARAFHIPPETTTEEFSYFSLCESRDGTIYATTIYPFTLLKGKNGSPVQEDPIQPPTHPRPASPFLSLEEKEKSVSLSLEIPVRFF